MAYVQKQQLDMTPMEIRVAMLKAGVKQASIAHQLRVTSQAVYSVVEGRAISHRIRKVISEAIGLELGKIWPSTYLYKGGPQKRGRPVTYKVDTQL